MASSAIIDGMLPTKHHDEKSRSPFDANHRVMSLPSELTYDARHIPSTIIYMSVLRPPLRTSVSPFCISMRVMCALRASTSLMLSPLRRHRHFSKVSIITRIKIVRHAFCPNIPQPTAGTGHSAVMRAAARYAGTAA